MTISFVFAASMILLLSESKVELLYHFTDALTRDLSFCIILQQVRLYMQNIACIRYSDV